MIGSKKELDAYISSDKEVNGINNGLSYIIKLLYGNVNAHSFRYLGNMSITQIQAEYSATIIDSKLEG